MKRFLHLLIFTCFISAAQKDKYAVKYIQHELTKEAHAVLRAYDLEFEVKDIDRAATRVKKAVTVLDEAGKMHGFVDLYYDNFTRVGEVKARLYNREGKLIKKVVRSGFFDFPAIANFSLYEDNRWMYYYPEYTSYPYTVEVEYQLVHQSLLNTPQWKPQYSNDIAVESSSFVLKFPKSNPVKYTSSDLPKLTVSHGTYDTTYQYSWNAEKLPSLKNRRRVVDTVASPRVLTSPETIYMDGYIAENSTWVDFGQWFYDLNKERDALEAESVATLREITKHLVTEKEKVKAIYELLQQKTRYVNISLGIGGYQSLPSKLVDEVGYGDCKALTTYTKGMLKAIGIESNHVLVMAGRDHKDVKEEFPSNQFNHVILAVPTESDTLWLECTSQQIPFGFLGSFTNDRKALWIADGASEIVNTPSYDARDNEEQREFKLDLNSDGSAIITLDALFTGLRSELGGLNYVAKEPLEDQKEWIDTYINLPGAELTDFSITDAETPEIRLHAEFQTRNLAQKSGNDLIFRLSPITKAFEKGSKVRSGGYEYQVSDSIIVEFDKELSSGLVADKEVGGEFGNYEIHIAPYASGLIIKRSILSKKHGATNSESYRNFCKKVIRNDQRAIVLKSKT